MSKNIVNTLKGSIADGGALVCVYATDDSKIVSCVNGNYTICSEMLSCFLEDFLKDADDTLVGILSGLLFKLIYEDKCRREGIATDTELTEDTLDELIAEAAYLDKFRIDASNVVLESDITDWDKFIEGFSESVENEDCLYLVLCTVHKSDNTEFVSDVRGTFGDIGNSLLGFIQVMLSVADDNVAKYLRGSVITKIMAATSERNIMIDFSDN